MASSLLMLETEYLLAISSLLLLTLSKECADRIEFCFSLSSPLLIDDVARLLELCVLCKSAKSCFTWTTTTSSLVSGTVSGGGSGEGWGVWTLASRICGLGLGVSLVGISPNSGNWALEWLSSREETGEAGAEIDLVKVSFPSKKIKIKIKGKKQWVNIMIFNWKQEVINTSSIHRNTGILELYLQIPAFLSHDFIFSSVPRFLWKTYR